MSKFGKCIVCARRFHYSDTSALTVNLDMAGFDAPSVCNYFSCESEVRRSNPVLSALGDGVTRV